MFHINGGKQLDLDDENDEKKVYDDGSKMKIFIGTMMMMMTFTPQNPGTPRGHTDPWTESFLNFLKQKTN